MKTYVLYNRLSNNSKGLELAKRLDESFFLADEEREYVDLTATDYAAFFASLPADARVILCGGDGTLNYFVNHTQDIKLPKLLYCPCGTGNDFANDIGRAGDMTPFPLDEYIAHLPKVVVNGKESLFLNGIGYGIDGYCCEVGDELRKTSDKPINYAGIAIKGLLGKFAPRKAHVEVDGVAQDFDHVWLAPAMNGRFYGGGMMIAPAQSRLHNDTISLVVLHCRSKLATLILFPSIFKGEHVTDTKKVYMAAGKHIHVEFDRPTSLQIDGDTVLGVTEYDAYAAE